MIIIWTLAVIWYFILGIVVASLAARFGSEDFQVRSKYSNSINPLPVIIFLFWPLGLIAGVGGVLFLACVKAIEKLSGSNVRST